MRDQTTDQSTPVMYFNNMVFRAGLNITVRRGTKWRDTRGPVVAKESREGASPKKTVIDVVDTAVMPFYKLNEQREYHGFLQFEHDPACRNYHNLIKVMRAAYAPDTPTSQGGFNVTEDVTVVFFTASDPTIVQVPKEEWVSSQAAEVPKPEVEESLDTLTARDHEETPVPPRTRKRRTRALQQAEELQGGE